MKVFNRAIKVGGHERLINDVTVQALEYDGDSKVLLCTGTTVPTADSSGFAKGCLFIKTDAADGTKGLYENAGTTTASDFNLVGAIAAAEITLAEGNVLVGNSSGVGVALDIGATNAGIAVGNGTTATIVALSGNATMTNAGVVTVTGSTGAFTATGLLTATAGITSVADIILESGTAVPATAGAVAAGAPITLYSTGVVVEVTSDTPTHTRPKGSICINTGGTTTSTRVYVNTDGAGTWTSITTAA